MVMAFVCTSTLWSVINAGIPQRLELGSFCPTHPTWVGMASQTNPHSTKYKDFRHYCVLIIDFSVVLSEAN